MRINAETLRTIRQDRGVTVSELAGMAGISQAYLSNIEAGRKNPSAAVIRSLSKALCCRLVALLGPEDPEAAEAEARAS